MKSHILFNPSLKDLHQIAKLHQKTLPESFLSPLPLFIIVAVYFIFLHSTPNRLITLSKSGEIYAFVFVFTATAWPQLLHPSLVGPEVQFICVHPQYQNQGCGTLLLKTLTASLNEQGINTFIVGTKSSNPKSNSFYQKLGYDFISKIRILGSNLNYYRSPLPKNTLPKPKA